MIQPSRQPAYRSPLRTPPQNVQLPKKAKRKELWVTAGAIVVAVLLLFFFWNHHRSEDKQLPTNPKTQTNTTTPAGFNKQQFSLTDPASIWVVVNKKHPLNPKDYVPGDLVVPNIPLRVPGNESMQVRQATATALEQLVTAAKTDGLSLMLSSGYRSYTYQVNLYNGYVKSIGQTEADKSSARPSYSEHQTGFAADLEPASRTCEVDACFADTPEGKWLAANAYKYGFLIRYQADKVAITGYEYEPWHVRYIGAALATEMHDKGSTTLEEFFGVSGGDYPN